MKKNIPTTVATLFAAAGLALTAPQAVQAQAATYRIDGWNAADDQASPNSSWQTPRRMPPGPAEAHDAFSLNGQGVTSPADVQMIETADGPEATTSEQPAVPAKYAPATFAPTTAAQAQAAPNSSLRVIATRTVAATEDGPALKPGLLRRWFSFGKHSEQETTTAPVSTSAMPDSENASGQKPGLLRRWFSFGKHDEAEDTAAEYPTNSGAQPNVRLIRHEEPPLATGPDLPAPPPARQGQGNGRF